MKFFNHIRRRLLQRNRFGNYMLYAIGEIILVVIGILIAIQVDDMKNEREILQREDLFITQLKRDLDESKRSLRSARRLHDSALIMTNYVIHAFWKPELQHDSLAPYIVDMLNIPEEFKPNTGTITSLVYSGNIELIQSFRVRNSLLVYLEKVTAISEQIRILLDGMGDGIPQISEVFDPSSYKRQYERNAGILEDSLDSKVAKRLFWRVDFEEVPFPAQLEEIFQNRNVYRGYQGIAVGHRTVERLYRDLIDATDNLQRVLEQEGY